MSMLAEIVLAQKLEKMTQRAEAAEAALADRDKPCVHTLRDGWIDTECGTSSSIVREWEFCPYCGHPVEVAP